MSLLRAGRLARTALILLGMLIVLPAIASAEDFLVFKSDEYGFTMKYPATWVKIDKPQGNYYVVFQAPELTDNFRSRIHVAAHSPVKDALEVFKQELKQGIADMQGKTAGSKEKQSIQILDEGDFKSEVPGAYFFFIQAYEDKLKMWMDIVIVFYKHEDTLLRVSCLAPSQSMEKFHALFNQVLVSVKFNQAGAPVPQAQPPATTPRPGAVAPAPTGQPPAPGAQQPAQQVAPPPAQAPQMQPPPPATAPSPEARPVQPTQPQPGPPPASTTTQPAPQQGQPAGPPPGPRGPSRTPDRPPTGIVN